MRTQDIEYRADGVRMVGQYVVDDGSSARRPGVLVIHEGPGLTEHTKKIAARLAGLGYACFAMDYHGEGKPHPNLADVRPQIATVALAARFQSVAIVTAGTTLGMLIANAPVVLFGDAIAKRLPLHIVRIVAALLFVALGVAAILMPAAR